MKMDTFYVRKISYFFSFFFFCIFTDFVVVVFFVLTHLFTISSKDNEQNDVSVVVLSKF